LTKPEASHLLLPLVEEMLVVLVLVLLALLVVRLV
jgi:hypothetical protein